MSLWLCIVEFNSMHANYCVTAGVLLLYFGACYVRVIMVSGMYCYLCVHILYMCFRGICVVHCVCDCGLWLFCARTQQLAMSYEIMATVTLEQVESFKLEGGNWNVYTERLDKFLVANRVADNTKKVTVIQTVIGGRAYALLQNFLAPTKPADKMYGEPFKVMKDHLKPKLPVITERFKFHRWNQ